MRPGNVSRVLVSFSAAVLVADATGSPARAGTGIWTPVGPGMGGAAAIVTHPGSPGAVWIGLPAGGVYASGDLGASWSWQGRPLAGWGVNALAADPATPAALWAATSAAVFHSADGGAHWSQVSDASYAALLGPNSPEGLVASGGVLYTKASNLEVGAQRLLASGDGGVSWHAAYDTDQDHSIRAVSATTSGAGGIYISVESPDEYAPVQLLHSLDGGQTWTASAGPWDQPSGRGIFQIAVTPGAVFVANDQALLRSLDGGTSWETVLGGDERVEPVILVADPRAPHALWVADEQNRLWITRDDGATWVQRQIPDPPPIVVSLLAVDPEAHALYAYVPADDSIPDSANPDKLWRSRDGGATWQAVLAAPSQDSLPYPAPAQVSWRPGDPAPLAMSVGGSVYLSADGGRGFSWLPTATRIEDLDRDPSDPDRLIALDVFSISLSKDGGRTWSSVYGSYGYLDRLLRADRRTLFASGCGIARSPDRGRTWGVVLPCRSRGGKTARYVQKIAMDSAHPSSVYALAFLVDGYVRPDHGVYAGAGWPSVLWRSDDGGVTWKEAAQGLRAFAIGPAGARVYAVRDTSLIASDDGGARWKTVSAVPPNIRDLLAGPPGPGPATFYATDGDGVLRSRDGGSSWQRFDRSAVPGSYLYADFSSLVQSPADPHALYALGYGAILHIAFPEVP